MKNEKEIQKNRREYIKISRRFRGLTDHQNANTPIFIYFLSTTENQIQGIQDNFYKNSSIRGWSVHWYNLSKLSDFYVL